EPHHLPLVRKFLETEPGRELGVEQADRVRPSKHLDKLEFSAFAVPDRGCLPGASTIDHHYGRFIEARERKRAQGMRIMVVDPREALPRRPEVSAEEALAVGPIFLEPADAVVTQSRTPSHRMGARQVVA